MNLLRPIFAVALADFRERVRRYSYLLTLLATVYLGYAAATGKVILSLDNNRGVYTAGWIGLMVALVTTVLVALIGFYIVKNAVDRDRVSRVGQILATTPLSRPAYMLGKFLSNFAVLGSVVLLMALGAFAIFFTAAEDPQLHLWALLSPFLLVALPAMALTAAAALLFENIPFLRGGFGNVLWFFIWAFSIGMPEILKRPHLDPLGLIGAMNTLLPLARATIPGYKNGIALTIANNHVGVARDLHFAGLPWTPATAGLRILWFGVALALVFVAAVLFDRFDEARSWFPRFASRTKSPAKSAAESAAVAVPNPAASKTAPLHLTALDRTKTSGGFLRIFQAELRLTLQGNRWWWYLAAIGLIIAQFTAPLSAVRGPILLFSWLWPTLLWSALGAREARFSTRQLLFSCANILPRQLLACWLAGVAVSLLMSCGAVVRLFLAQEFSGLLALLAGALFIPSLALALGVISGSSKFFEGLYTAWWYIGPLNHSPGIDYTGLSSGALVMHYALMYFIFALALLAAAFFARARQLRASSGLAISQSEQATPYIL